MELILVNEKSTANPIRSKKTINNYLSSLRLFQEFLFDEEYRFKDSISDKVKADKQRLFKITQLPDIKYSREKLVGIFYSRILTQDRSYQKYVFNLRIINKLFKERDKIIWEEFRSIIKEKLKETKFVLDNTAGKIATLDDVCYIILPENLPVQIVINKEKHLLYSMQNFDSKQYGEFYSTELRNLSLDHDRPLEKIFNNKNVPEKFEYLSKLSEEIVAYCVEKIFQ
ncbi:hypothetical protein D3X11_06555 [Streptococcus sp. X16XC17]|uniref:hypothetical protein n=1 Tax=unclassified Streptococcus TaxID=2608887 RepID=UPI00066FD255|nr:MULTISPECIES: hypothetical protein [unclassified Streptococcus]TCD45858.1 hypothetical protein D3X11_06555 [Streptococcus sp. X16XC17]